MMRVDYRDKLKIRNDLKAQIVKINTKNKKKDTLVGQNTDHDNEHGNDGDGADEDEQDEDNFMFNAIKEAEIIQ